jgi:predicted transposase YbfD/YdcC
MLLSVECACVPLMGRADGGVKSWKLRLNPRVNRPISLHRCLLDRISKRTLNLMPERRSFTSGQSGEAVRDKQVKRNSSLASPHGPRRRREHMVPAFAARQCLVPGQVKVAEKPNEIAAIPKLLDMLAIEGAIVIIDAMGCQREIAARIIGKKADYILALKGNQGTLRKDVEELAAGNKTNESHDMTISRHEAADDDHGRIETRTNTVIHDVASPQERHDWPERHHNRKCARNW